MEIINITEYIKRGLHFASTTDLAAWKQQYFNKVSCVSFWEAPGITTQIRYNENNGSIYVYGVIR